MIKDHLLSDEKFAEELETVVRPFLSGVHSDITVERPDGIVIKGHYYRCEGSDSVIFIVHGFTEFSERYLEIIYYFLKMGMSVAICDHRGHGYSGRPLANPCMIHVNSYDEYVGDYEAFVSRVNELFHNTHKYLFGHSMGGCIASLYLENCRNDIEKCVLSAPMHEPHRDGYPKWLAKLLCRMLVALGKGEHYLWDKNHDYRPIETFEKSCATEYNRWKVFNDIRIDNEAYHTSDGSVRWRYESIQAADRSVKDAGKIRIPVLLIQAENDNMVLAGGHSRFAGRSRNTRILLMKGEKHESFNSVLSSRERFYEEIEKFFGSD